MAGESSEVAVRTRMAGALILQRSSNPYESATLSRSPRHPVGWALGDLLVRQPSAYGASRRHPGLFPGADRLHLPRAGHCDLLNHPDVHRALREWLGETAESAVGEQHPDTRGSTARSG